ncbi:MAG: hypothetical protein U9O78_03815 [Patescibacteria group bacterium]|nr:hypothetical protein [Patescibacteria group bacterium]
MKIKTAFISVLLLVFFLLTAGKAWALEDKLIGVHLLSTGDLKHAHHLLRVEDDWHFVTIPLTLDDLNQQSEWRDFFIQCRRYHFVPIIRLATKVENGFWLRPSRRQIVQMFNFLDGLDWPTNERFIIAFNEVNHAKEWGGRVNAATYVETLNFVRRWAHTEEDPYLVLPAALDLDAPNSSETVEAFAYLNQMLRYDPTVFDEVDIWNSHSYPNPAFSSSPTKTGKNSLRGFLYELNYLKRKTGRDFKVIITETGWKANSLTQPWLENYYLYALQHIWSHPQVIGVTLFVVQGSPGPFEEFSFFNEQNQPTAHHSAFQKALLKLNEEE